jgi:glucose-1-phosphate adenylyltransferase
MGIYIFERRFLMSTLERMKKVHEDLDFGKHIIPDLVRRGRVSAFTYGGYWLDIGTLKSYYQASLSLLSKRPRLELSGTERGVMTAPDDYPPMRLQKGSRVEKSMICSGCVISGEVFSSILSPGVVVERGAMVANSVILHDCVIGRGASVVNSILDKEVRIGREASVGEGNRRVRNDTQPEYLDFGMTLVGKGALIPAGISVGTNCLLSGRIGVNDLGDGGSRLEDG